jgi:phosphatidylglycerophosphatase C
VAAFDFDGTITRRDTLVPFLRRFRGLPRFAWAFVQALPGALTGPDRREAYKAAVFRRLLTGVPADDLAAAAVDYGRQLPAQFRPDTVERIRWHQEEGHEVVIVSASLRAYLDPVVEHLGLDGVCAVELEVADDGRLTGRMVGPNCRGPEKVVRLTDWLVGNGQQVLVA